MAQIKRSIRPEYVSVFAFIFSAEVHIAKPSYFHEINSASDTCNLFKTFNSLSLSTTSLTADDYATFFTDKTKTISSQFSAPHIQV